MLFSAGIRSLTLPSGELQRFSQVHGAPPGRLKNLFAAAESIGNN
jgi:hypothetical protein